MTKSVSPVRSVGVHEAKTQLSELLRLVEAGEEIEIRRNQQPLARLVPVPSSKRRTFGSDTGVFTVPDDFDAPLDEDLLRDFEG